MPTRADWQTLADKEVKGKDLSWHTPEGFAIQPLYTAEDAPEDPGLPGFAPFTRGGEGLDVRRPPVDHSPVRRVLDG